MSYFKEQIEKFKQGEPFEGTVDPEIIKAGLADDDLMPVSVALKYETDEVRSETAIMLTQFGFQADEMYALGINILRNKKIVSILIDNGLSETGPVRDFILESIQAYVPGEMINSYGNVLIDELTKRPDPTLLLVIAKGKILEANTNLNDEQQSEAMKDWDEYPLARAALGDKELEKSFIASFKETDNPEEKAEFAKFLAYIGTRAALKALAEEMRTDLILDMTNVMLKSVRLDIAAALAYNYPGKAFLYDNAIMDDDGYARIEKFCEDNFGVTWTNERPEFLTVQGFPSQPAPE